MATSPVTADLAEKERGSTIIDRIRAIRAEFGLSLAAAKAVVDANDGRPPAMPDVCDRTQLDSILVTELGYCNCASSSALAVLRDLLRAAETRTDATCDPEEFARASRSVEALLAGGGGWAEWLVYGLQQRGLVWHGFRQADLWVTDKGRWLLRAVEQVGT